MAEVSKTAVGEVEKKETNKTTANKTEKSTEKRAGTRTKNTLNKTARKTSKKAVKRTVKKPAKKIPRKKPNKAQRQPPVKQPKERPLTGIEKLRLVADECLFEIAEAVVQELKDNARKGKLDSTKMLVTLADKKKLDPVKKPDPEQKPYSVDWLLNLAAEPEFRDLAQSKVKAAPVAVQTTN